MEANSVQQEEDESLCDLVYFCQRGETVGSAHLVCSLQNTTTSKFYLNLRGLFPLPTLTQQTSWRRLRNPSHCVTGISNSSHSTRLWYWHIVVLAGISNRSQHSTSTRISLFLSKMWLYFFPISDCIFIRNLTLTLWIKCSSAPDTYIIHM